MKKQYRIAILTGDLEKPLARVLKTSLDSVHSYVCDLDSSFECSVIIEHLEDNGDVCSRSVFFGSIRDFFKKEYHQK